jgi:fused signal recognition particle receptor
VSTFYPILLIALAAQIPLIALAYLIEFSRRKARPQPSVQPPALPQALPVPEPAAPDATTPPEPAHAPTPAAIVEEVPAAPPIEIGAVPEDTRPVAPAEAEPAPPVAVAPPGGVVEAGPTPVEAEPRPVVVEAPPPPPIEAEPAPRAVTPPTRAEPVRIGLGLRRTRENFLARIRAALSGSAKVDEIYEGLEEALIGADVGVETSMKIVEAVRGRLKSDVREAVIRDALKDSIAELLQAVERPLKDSGDAPFVIMLAGVNGVGKTTTVAKLAVRMKDERGPVVVAASDTFRAAAIEQLQVWCDRAGVDLIKQKPGADPAAVAFDAVKAAVARKARVVLIDTAGRLQTKVNLMEELKKIGRVVGRELPGAPHETWLVLDATTGQNALSQAKIFGEATPLTGVVLAKLDSTAKGGVIVAIAERLKLPVRFVGLGEGIEDLREFDAREFVNALFSEADESPDSASSTYAA